jgi:uncharacterized membrane protein YesL
LTTLRLALRSYREFYDIIWWMILATAIWWFMLISVVFAPAATLLLFRQADPRLGIWEERPSLREMGRYLLAQFGRSWLLAVATVPLLALMTFNLSYYGGSGGAISLLAPFWLVLLIIGVIATLIIFGLAALSDVGARDCLRDGLRLTGLHFPTALVVLVITFVIPALLLTSLFQFLIPLTLILPGLVATAFSRFVLRASRMPYPKPNEPTEERLHERHSD